MLVAVLRVHEQTIRNRWNKKTRKERQAILLKAWPNMCPKHRPDFDALRKESEPQRKAATKFKEAFFWPHINQEDLLDRGGKNMLRFLNSRGRNPLDTFRRLDLENAHIGDEHGALNSIVLPPGYWANVRECTPEGYCRIEQYTPLDTNWNVADRVPPGDGMDILIIQEGTMRFLTSFCKAMLQDVNFERLDQPSTNEPEPIKIEEVEWQSLSSLSTIAPYLKPEPSNLGYVKELVWARLYDSHGHINSLLEDPAYFVETVEETSDHNPTYITDHQDRRPPRYLLATRWETIIPSVVGNSFEANYWWSYLNQLFEELVEQEKEFVEKNLSSEEDLPAYLELLQKIKWILQYPLTNIYFSVASLYYTASKPLRHLFVREGAEIKLRSGGDTKDAQDYLLWLLGRLSDKTAADQHGINNLAVEIERVLSKSQAEKKRVTSLVAATIADLGLVWEIHNQLARYRPRIFAWKRFDRDLEAGGKAMIEQWAKPLFDPPNDWRETLTTFRNKVQGLPQKSDILPYPSDKKRSQQHVAEMQKAEHNLDTIWSMIDQFMKDNIQQEESKLYRVHYLIFRSTLPLREGLSRTEDWNPPQSRTMRADVDTLGEDFRELELERRTLTEGTLSSPTKSAFKRKTKQKRKPIPQFELGAPAPGGPAPVLAPEVAFAPQPATPSTPKPLFLLKKRWLNVFKTVFHNPDIVGNQIVWQDFVQAMINIGFSAEKLFGSVWRFMPPSENMPKGENKARAILFHEPHPDSTVPYVLARRFGRRLDRVYGFESWMFAEKVTE